MARREERTGEFPLRKLRPAVEHVSLTLLIPHDRNGRLVLERKAFPHLPQMWLPLVATDDDLNGAVLAGRFTHTIVRRRFRVRVFAKELGEAALRRLAAARRDGERSLFERRDLAGIGRSSLLTKSLALADATR